MIQRAGGGLNVKPHFHTLVLDGVFRLAAGRLEFHPAPGPSDAEVAEILTLIRDRIQRLLQRRGLVPEDDATGPRDRLGEESLLRAELVSASVPGAGGAGRGVRRLGEKPDGQGMMSRGPRQAQLEGSAERGGAPALCGAAYEPLDVEAQHARVPLGAGTRIGSDGYLPASGCAPAI